MMGMVFDAFAVECELSGILDTSGLLCERSSRKGNSIEQRP